jgi:hypothetical protein
MNIDIALEVRLEGFLFKLDELREKLVPGTPAPISYTIGKKYIKVVEMSTCEKNKISCVWGFITEKGDILKANSFNSPHKKPRGNIFSWEFDGQSNLNEIAKYIGPYGPNYIK